MKTILSIAVLLLLSGHAVAAMPCSSPTEEQGAAIATANPPAATPSGAQSAGVSPAEIKQALDQAQQLLHEQAEALRQMHQEIERQGKEIESLRQQRLENAPEDSASAAEEAAAGTEKLQNAVHAMRAPASAAVAVQVPGSSSKAKGNKPAELFFRIGNATFTPSGWVDFTAYFRSIDVGSGLGTNFQSIPYSNTALGGLSETRLTAQSSRLGLRVDESVGQTHAYGYAEADFNGYLPGNAYVSTNSNTLRMRVYYLNLARNKWELLGGQGWSLLTPTRKALSPFLADLFTTFHLDTSYQAGLPYARQTQLRFVYHPTTYWAAGISVENSEQYSGSAVVFPTLFTSTESDTNSSTGVGGGTTTPNAHPDVIAKTTWDRNVYGLYWHMGVAGLLTATRINTPASITKAKAVNDMREGGAFVGNFNLEVFKGFHLIGLGFWSDGGGRYMGGMGPGFVVLQQGKATSPFTTALIHSGSGIGGFEWVLNKRTTISSYGSAAYFQRRFGIDHSVATPVTYVGYGYPGSPSSNNRIIKEVSFASTTTFWQKPSYGALQLITQSSYVERAPWYVSKKQPKDAHTFMEFVNLRYVLP